MERARAINLASTNKNLGIKVHFIVLSFSDKEVPKFHRFFVANLVSRTTTSHKPPVPSTTFGCMTCVMFIWSILNQSLVELTQVK